MQTFAFLRLVLNVLIVLFATAVGYALYCGGTVEIFTWMKISIYNPFKPLAFLFLCLVARIWISPPLQLWPEEKLAHLITRFTKIFTGAPQTASGMSPLGRLLQRGGCGFFKPGGVWQPSRTIFVLMITWTLGIFLYPTIVYLTFGSIPDLNIYIEALDSGAMGKPFLNTFHYLEFNGFNAYLGSGDHPKASAFAMHFQPVLYFFVPFFKFLPSPVMLFFLSALILGSSIWPVYQLARRILQDERFAVGITLCYCLNPMVIATARAFLPGVYSVSLLLWSIWFALNKRLLLMTLMLLLTLACKEIMALPVISFGVFLVFFRRQYVVGSLIVLFAFFYLYACIHWIMPSFLPERTQGYLTAGSLYPQFGASLSEIIQTIAFKPWTTLPFIFSAATLKYMVMLLLPLIFVPVLGWQVFLLNIPVLAQNLLVGIPGDCWQRDILRHWSAPLIPFTFLALIFGFDRLRKIRSARQATSVIFMMLVFSLFLTLFSMRQWSDLPLQKTISWFKTQGKEGTSVSSNLFPAWGALRLDYDLAVFPKNGGTADYILLAWSPQLTAQMGKDGHPLSYTELPKVNFSNRREADIYLHYASMYYHQLSADPTLMKIWEIPEDGGIKLITIFARKKT